MHFDCRSNYIATEAIRSLEQWMHQRNFYGRKQRLQSHFEPLRYLRFLLLTFFLAPYQRFLQKLAKEAKDSQFNRKRWNATSGALAETPQRQLPLFCAPIHPSSKLLPAICKSHSGACERRSEQLAAIGDSSQPERFCKRA
jgi:hypothetical protein